MGRGSTGRLSQARRCFASSRSQRGPISISSRPPCSGPYIVEEQPTTTSLVLKDPQSGKLVDGGAKIPLDQIVAGPRKARLRFEEEEDVRPYSQMVGRDSLPVTEPLRRGGTPSRTTGWGGCIKGLRWRISASHKARTRGSSALASLLQIVARIKW